MTAQGFTTEDMLRVSLRAALDLAREMLGELHGAAEVDHRANCGGDGNLEDFGLSRCTHEVCVGVVRALKAYAKRLPPAPAGPSRQVVIVGRRNGKAVDLERWLIEQEAAGRQVIPIGRDGRTLAAIDKSNLHYPPAHLTIL